MFTTFMNGCSFLKISMKILRPCMVACDVKLSKVCLVSWIKAVFFYETLFHKVGGLNSMNLP